ncbi:MAG: VOC family protein [Akkermansiaceae bacterium]|nr:VOC family protein [Armatimonadota bacterium]
MLTLTLNLVVLYSHEPERLVKFYERLGLTFDRHRHGAGAEHHAAELPGGTVFEIYPAKPDEAATRVRLGFRVASVDDCVAELAAHGVTVVSKPKDSERGRRAVVADPEGNRVELIEEAHETTNGTGM